MKRIASLVMTVLACTGCHMCSNCCDYSAPVAGGPFPPAGGRAGSAISGGYIPLTAPLPTPTPPNPPGGKTPSGQQSTKSQGPGPAPPATPAPTLPTGAL